MQFKVEFDGLEWRSTLPGARFKTAVCGNKQMRLLELTQEFVEPGWCVRGHLGTVLAGEIEIDFQGEVVRYPAGSGILIPAGPEGAHMAKAMTPTALLLLVEDA